MNCEGNRLNQRNQTKTDNQKTHKYNFIYVKCPEQANSQRESELVAAGAEEGVPFGGDGMSWN